MSVRTILIPGHLPFSANIAGVAWEIEFVPSPETLRKRAAELALADYENQVVPLFQPKIGLAEYESYYNELLGVSKR